MEATDRWTLTLVHQKPESETATTFAFRPQPALTFRAGQWLHLACVAQPNDRALVRHMSVASAPQDALVEFTMDTGSGSVYKTTLAALKPGDTVAAFKLRGDFVVAPDETRPLCFLAGGLGITPIRSILKDLAARGSRVPRQLVHVSRGAHLFAPEMAALGVPQTRTDHAGWNGLKAGLLRDAGPSTVFYLCGSQRFLDGVRADLAAAGVAPDRILAEDFH